MQSELKKFLIYLEFNQGLAKSSIESYNSDLKLFNIYLQKQKICNLLQYKKINKKIIIQYIKYLINKNYLETSISRKKIAIKSLFSYLLKIKKITKDPTIFLKHHKKNYKLPLFLSIKEVELLIKKIHKKTTDLTNRDDTIIELMYSCGLRVSELANLSTQNINYKESIITVLGKGNKERIIPFGNFAKAKLKNYSKKSRGKLNKKLSLFFFINRNGEKLTRQRIWQIIKQRAKLSNINKKISPHTLRHSFATHLLDNDAPLNIIQKLLGHKSIKTTEIYTHLSHKKLLQIHKKSHPRS